ncbi:replication fork protection component Swi3-domain-containing protein [Mycotypha africana]|uniref:replication fork protection component Swi3-domain-containing protein n=1 Tax=Mycotypha africana TaxID=64632 RepID=UPI00230091F3|nr:replication fork protection component Swi3-domain-containing protein [Mycotypha africana]KAI8977372.1 replication fork protection component Swi3-domain-containing protein [Mycotypha africana]
MAEPDEFGDLLLDDYDIDTSNNNNKNDPGDSNLENADEQLTQRTARKKRLDADLLLSPEGLLHLKSESQNLRFKGKGFEDEDLKKLITYYTVWAHNLYPKLRFQDFTRRVVKQTSKASVKLQVEQWQQEYRERRQVRRDIMKSMMDNTTD